MFLWLFSLHIGHLFYSSMLNTAVAEKEVLSLGCLHRLELGIPPCTWMALCPRFALLREQRLSRAAHLCELGLKDLVESLTDDQRTVTKVVVQFEGKLHLAIVPFVILGTISLLVLCCGILHREIELSRGASA